MSASTDTTQVGQDDAIVHRIVSAVAETEQCSVLDLPPLSGAIDVDALSRVAHGRGVTEIMFSYHGYRVTIDGDGRVDVMSQQE